MATTFERLDDRINMLRAEENKPEAILPPLVDIPNGSTILETIERAIRVAYAQGRKDQHRETAALFRGIMAV